MSTNGNEPVFGGSYVQYEEPDRNGFSIGHTVSTALTKRELFAAMAMQGLCSSVGDAPRDAGGWISRAAMRSTWLADALLAELAKEQP